MQRPNEREFLKSVLDSIDELPRGLADSLVSLVDAETDSRSDEILRAIEESTGD